MGPDYGKSGEFRARETRSTRASVLAALDLQEDSVSLTSPGTQEVDRDDDSLSKVLGDEHKYRSVVAAIKFSWPLTCQTGSSRAQRLVGMSAPTVQSWKKNQTHRQVT